MPLLVFVSIVQIQFYILACKYLYTHTYRKRASENKLSSYGQTVGIVRFTLVLNEMIYYCGECYL